VLRFLTEIVWTKDVTPRQAGGSVSATLPKDMADRLHLEAGDRVLAVETDRGILVTPYDPEGERALKVASKAAKSIETRCASGRNSAARWRGHSRNGPMTRTAI
jgi:antitoxin MazE